MGKWFVSYNIRVAPGIARRAAAERVNEILSRTSHNFSFSHYAGNRPVGTGKLKLTPLIRVLHREGFQDLVRRHPI